jgi:carboxypeptidase PM20D1
MKKILFRLLLLVVFIITTVLLYNTFTSYSKQVNEPAVQGETVSDSVLTRLSAALKIPSISRPFQVDTAALDALHKLIDSSYTNVGRTLRRTRVNRYSLLYRWEGKNTNLNPILIMAHQDVVPVSEETLNRWTYPPFSGAIADGYVWGVGRQKFYDEYSRSG